MTAEIIDHLKNGNSLLKFAYKGKEGVINFKNIIRSEDYNYFNNEIELVKQNATIIAKKIKERLVVLGVGNGQKLGVLGEHIEGKSEVILVDLCDEFLKNARQIINCNVRIERNCFETMDMSKFRSNTTFLILGGTIGNVSDYMCYRKKIRKSCPESTAIIGLEFYDNSNKDIIKKILDGYSSQEALEFVFHPLKTMGFDYKHGNFKILYNEKQERIEKNFIFNENSNNKRKHFGIENIESALLALSLKPSKRGFFEKLSQNNFNIGFILTNRRNSIFEIFW